MTEEKDDGAFRYTPFEKWEYSQIFFDPDGEFDTIHRMDFYEAALLSVQRIAGSANDIGAAAGVYLFRHYLELTLKALVLGSRHLESAEKNAPAEGVSPPARRHHLVPLWSEVKNHVPRKLGRDVWNRWDHKFVESCIQEFSAFDETGERARYADRGRDRSRSMQVDWQALLRAMGHVHDVLEAIDSYLVETHGDNSDWEHEQNSWL